VRSTNGWLFTLGLAQAGEFGFVLLTYSVQSHVSRWKPPRFCRWLLRFPCS
jgi:hypothetical protein